MTLNLLCYCNILRIWILLVSSPCCRKRRPRCVARSHPNQKRCSGQGIRILLLPCHYLFHPVEIKFWVAKLLMSRRTPIPIGVLRWTIKCLHFVHIAELSAYVSIVLKNTSGVTSVHPLYNCRLFKNSGICCKMGWRIQRSMILLIRRLSLTVFCPRMLWLWGVTPSL
jgi:hypothetical protein